MNDLERRALLGDRRAQEECTEKGIALRCPACGCEDKYMIGICVSHSQYFYTCEACGCSGPIVLDNDECDYPEHKALALWNCRPAPPIGRCKDCAYYPLAREEIGGYVYCPQSEMQIENEDYFCSSFEPREG